MDFSLTAEQAELRDSVLRFTRGRLLPREGTEEEGFRRDLWEAMAEFGILGLAVPVDRGGSGLGVTTTTVAMEALGLGGADSGLLFSLHAHLWSVMMPLLTFGGDDQVERYLPGLMDGRVVGAHGMSEPGSGSDAFSLRTRAERDGDDYVLNGTKTFVTNAPVADLFLVFATVNPSRGFWGVTAFLLEKDMPGLQVSPPFEKMGLRGSPMGEVVLQDCRVPATQRLGEEGQGSTIFNHSMIWERGCILGSTVGRMGRQLEQTVQYAKEREQFGRPIGDFQLVAARIADMRMRLETCRLLLYRTAWAHEAGEPTGLHAAMAKTWISEAAVASALDAVKVHGGYGYMEEFEAARDLRDAVGGTLYSGTSEIQRLIIARELGLDPR